VLAKIVRKTIGPKIQNIGVINFFVQKQNYRLRQKKKDFLISSTKSCGLALDCGCGNGKFTNTVKSSICSIVSIDLSKTDLQEYRRKIGKEKANVLIASIDALPFRQDVFDLALLLDCLEHGSDPQIILKQVFGCLHIKGNVIITAPNWYNRYLDVGAIGHQHFFSSFGWIRLVENAGLKFGTKTCLSFPIFDIAMFRNNLHFLGFWVALIGEKR